MKILHTIPVISLCFSVAASISLAGCGSSGGGGAATPNGIYTGSITGGEPSGAPINGGEKGVIYDERMMVFSTVAGIQQLFDAELTISGTDLSGTLDYYNNYSDKIDTASVSGSFVENTSATISFSNATNAVLPDGTINLVADTALFNKGSSQQILQGSWQGPHGYIAVMTSLAIDSVGAIAGDDDNCLFTGNIQPANTSINLYNVTIVSTGGASCVSLPPATYTGYAWTEGANDNTLNLTVADGVYSRSVVLTRT